MVMKFLFIQKLIEIDKHKIDWIKKIMQGYKY